MELAFLYKQWTSSTPEIYRLEAGTASLAFTLTPWNYHCLLFSPSNKSTQLLVYSTYSYVYLFLSPKALMHLNVDASPKSPQPCWTRKRESKHMLIFRPRGTNCALVWTRVCSWARRLADTVWQQAIVRPSAEAQRPERLHSLHMGEQFPPKWLLINGRPNYRQDWWVCLVCWSTFILFSLLTHKNWNSGTSLASNNGRTSLNGREEETKRKVPRNIAESDSGSTDFHATRSHTHTHTHLKRTIILGAKSWSCFLTSVGKAISSSHWNALSSRSCVVSLPAGLLHPGSEAKGVTLPLSHFI